MTSRKHAAVAVALAMLFSASALAQPSASSNPVGSNEALQQVPTKAANKAATKAERKRERKAARARKNAELKKLESSGYRPWENDPDYPQNLQKAQKRLDQGADQSN